MRIVLNTRSESAGAQASIVGLAQRLREAGVDAVLNDWDGYDRYDVAIFLGYDHELEAVRAANPRIRVGLADPKQSRLDWIEAARAADFLLVSSVEQREAFLRLNRNVHVFYMFPIVPERSRAHTNGGPLVIGYHGNRVHLEAMGATGAKAALEELGRHHDVELRLVYNLAEHGRALGGVPDERIVRVRHVQLEPGSAPGTGVSQTIMDEIAGADVGIAPNLLPVGGRRRALLRTGVTEPWLAYEPFDYLLRLKASSNPGRLYPFARLGIPVVADLTPSFAQFVLDGVSGFLAASPQGWHDALERLAAEPELRERTAGELRRRLDTAYERQIGDLLAFLATDPLPAPTAFAGQASAERELADLPLYASPSTAPARERRRARFRRLLRP